MNVVYLAGLISVDYPESLQWRHDVTPRLEDSGFKVLSPMRGKENLAKTSKDGGITDERLTSSDIVLRDYGDVLSSDVVLAHLDDFGSPRPLLGTPCELAWAWDHRIPVVGIAARSNRLYRTHPFIQAFVAHYCENPEDAVDFVCQHYTR